MPVCRLCWAVASWMKSLPMEDGEQSFCSMCVDAIAEALEYTPENAPLLVVSQTRVIDKQTGKRCGKGLYSLERIRDRKKQIATFYGRWGTHEEADEWEAKGEWTISVFSIKWFLPLPIPDLKTQYKHVACYANRCPTGGRNHCIIVQSSKKPYIRLNHQRTLHPYDEIYLSYGASYPLPSSTLVPNLTDVS
jgi:hypothetical protein